MAITGTKVRTNTSNKNWYVNEVVIKEATQMDSQYNDVSIRLKLEDKSNGYNYTAFVNQNYDKDANGVVVGLSYPDDLNTLYLASGADLNVSDIGEVNTDDLIGREVACINYASKGKYKSTTWGVFSALNKTNELEDKFKAQIAKGYPRNYQQPNETTAEEVFGGRARDTKDAVPF